jgi:Cof subfamily protein (haloacid dehalogenase superfamily)
MYKLIVSDVDGTLANNRKEVTPRTARAVRAAAERGVVVTLATGRTRQGIGDFLNYTSPDAPVIFANGAYISTASSDRLLYERLLDAETVREIWRRGEERGSGLVAWSRGRLFINRESGAMTLYQKVTASEAVVTPAPDSFAEQGVTKMLWVDKAENIVSALNELSAKPIPGACWFTSTPYYLEFAQHGVTKGKGLCRVAAFCGISPAEIIAIGDGMNDLSMLSYAGLGVAMRNAPEALRRAADFIAPSNEEDGAAQVIEQFILNQ